MVYICIIVMEVVILLKVRDSLSQIILSPNIMEIHQSFMVFMYTIQDI